MGVGAQTNNSLQFRGVLQNQAATAPRDYGLSMSLRLKQPFREEEGHFLLQLGFL